ncbi:cytochrome P450 [Actinomycetes bacterium KLBMP 9759]
MTTETVNDIPLAPKALPVIGHALVMGRSPLQFLESLAEAGAALTRIRIGTMSMVMVCDAGLVRHVLTHDRTFDRGGPVFARFAEVAGNGLVTCPHGDHRRQRRLVQPAFGNEYVRAYSAGMSRVIEDVVGSWRDGEVLDTHSALMTVTTGVLSSTLFGTALSPEKLAEAVADIGVVDDGIMIRTMVPRWVAALPTRSARNYRAAAGRVRDMLDRTVERRHALAVAGGVATAGRVETGARGGLLSVLLDDRNKETSDVALSESELSDQMVTFFLSGADTIAASLEWSLYLLAQHPDIADRLYRETSSVLRGRVATWDDLPRMPLVRWVLLEALRIYPPVWMFTRIVTADTTLGGYALPAGTSIGISPLLLHRQPGFCARPAEFVPDRHADGAGPGLGKSGIFTFGGGARRCIGDTFGLAEAQLVLATIASRWQVALCPGKRVGPTVAAVLRPRNMRVVLGARAR